MKSPAPSENRADQRRLINREALDEFRLKVKASHTAEIRGEL